MSGEEREFGRLMNPPDDSELAQREQDIVELNDEIAELKGSCDRLEVLCNERADIMLKLELRMQSAANELELEQTLESNWEDAHFGSSRLIYDSDTINNIIKNLRGEE